MYVPRDFSNAHSQKVPCPLHYLDRLTQRGRVRGAPQWTRHRQHPSLRQVCRCRLLSCWDLASSVRSTGTLDGLVAAALATRRHANVKVLANEWLYRIPDVLALNVDPEFGHCVDALVVVNVPSAPESTLRRFLGAEGLSRYLAVRTTGFGLTANVE